MATPSSSPRIAPGGRDDVGILQWVALKIGSRRMGGPVPNVMLTLARHRGAFIPWLFYSSRLMPYGKLPAAHSEFMILRVAARCGSEYEQAHHTALGRKAGLNDAIMDWAAEPVGAATPAPDGGKLDAARADLLRRATDELLDDRNLGDEIWSELSAVYREAELIELCLLVGHYAGLAATLNTLRTPIESGAGMNKLR